MKRTASILIAASLGLIACGERDAAKRQATSIENLRTYTETLAGDDFAGRDPFGPAAGKTVSYIARQMRAVGLTPYQGDSYLQPVSVVSARTECPGPMTIRTPKGEISLEWLEGYTAFSKRLEPEIEVNDARLVFAGYGIVAPEYGKDDFAGIENPEETVAVVIVNDPGLGSDDTSYFKGDEMTYYGRWRYKFEEGDRQRLRGVLIIHDDRGAGYPWSVVRASARSKMYVDDPADTTYHAPLNGWLRQDAARRLLADNGLDLDELRERAKRPDFKPVPLRSTVSAAMSNHFERKETPNVIGYIPGQTDESVVYLGHWDHLGYGAPIDGDSIINGATDNAVAVAWMLEIARRFKETGEKPRRNVVFLSPTCEEAGLLGSEYYTLHPLFPIEKVAAVINMDVFPLWGENNDLTITGYGHSDLDARVERIARKQGRYVMPDPDAYNGMFYRSDHFPFVRRGVPAMFAKGWNDNREHGKEWARAEIDRYWAEIYHKPTDETHPGSDDYAGLAQEVDLGFELGRELAADTAYPRWNPESEFARVLVR